MRDAILRGTTALVLALLVFAAPSCGQITDAQEVQAGKRCLEELIATGEVTVLDSPAGRERLERVGAKIARAAGRPGLAWAGGWQWLPVKFATGPNACAGPGGFVLVDTRLLRTLRDDGELAFILAHEAGHVVGRHGFRTQVEQAGVTSWLAGQLAKFLQEFIDPLLGKLVRGEFKYSQAVEYEADERALAIMERAGFDTRAALRWLAAEMYMRDDPAMLELWERVFGTHPPWRDRASHLVARSQDVLEKGPFLAFLRDNVLWVSRWNGTEQRRTSLRGSRFGEPRWSARGDTLAVECDGNVYALRATDLSVTQLTVSGNAGDPAWAPGGDQIACRSAGGIYVLSADGRHKRRLTDTRDARLPVWSSAGALIAYDRPREPLNPLQQEDKGIWLVPVQGGRSTHIPDSADTLPAEWIRFSPDSTKVAYGYCRQGFLQYVADVLRPRKAELIALGGGLSWSPGGHLLHWGTWEWALGPGAGGLSRYGPEKGARPTGVALKDLCVLEAFPGPRWKRLACLACEACERAEDPLPRCTELWTVEYAAFECRKIARLYVPYFSIHIVGWAPDATAILLALRPEGQGHAPTGVWLISLADAQLGQVIENCSMPSLAQVWPYAL